MNFDKLYDQILARKETRESSTLTMVTLASSASLILFIFFIQEENPLHQNLVHALGILFPLVAIGYREINFYYIHAHDNTVLNAILLKEFDGTNKQKKEIKEKIIQYKKNRRLKGFLLRFLIALPIFGWIMVFDYFVGFIINFILVMFIFVFSLDSSFREPKDSIPSFLKN